MSNLPQIYDTGMGQISAQLENVAPLVRHIISFCTHRNLADDDLMAIELSANEALNNAVEHGAGKDPEQMIEARWEIKGDQWILDVSDPGDYLPEEGKDNLPEDVLSERGRGSFLMAQLCDSTEHDQIRGRHHLRLTKRLKKAPAPVESPEEMNQTIASMAEELSTSFENLSALFRLAEQLAYSHSFTEFIQSSLDELMDLTRSNGAMVSSWNEDLSELITIGAKSVFAGYLHHTQTADCEGMEVSSALHSKEQSVEAGTALQADDPLHSLDGHLIFIPMSFADKPAGVLSLHRDKCADFFSSGDIHIARTFADFFSIAIVVESLQVKRAHEESAVRELAIAADLQKRLLPREFPLSDTFSIQGACTSARQVGGDYLDVIPLGDDNFLAVIADVMGKGVPAAMLATVFRTALYARLDLARSPAKLMEEMGAQLTRDIGGLEMFITAQIVYCNGNNRSLEICTAGHCPALIWSEDGSCQQIEEGGIPLGILSDQTYPAITCDFPPGSRLAIITDGFYEVENSEGEFLDIAGLLNLVRPHLALGGYDFLMQLIDEVNRYTGEAPPSDDRSAVIIDCLRKSTEKE